MENPIAIVFASWHGQAEKIARRIADVVYLHGVPTTILDVQRVPVDTLALDRSYGIIVVASVHFGHHPRALVEFARRKLTSLSSQPTAFVSVSGAAAALQGDAEAQRYIRDFVVKTGWNPDVTLSVAGAVPYSKYGVITRMIMKFAARVSGRDSDTSRDYEYTNWFAVEDFARGFLAQYSTEKKRGTA